MTTDQIRWLIQLGMAGLSIVSLIETGRRRGWL